MNQRVLTAPRMVAAFVVAVFSFSTQALPLHEDITVEGEMQVLCIENHGSQTSETVYAIVEAKTNKVHKVRFEGDVPEHVSSGDHVKVHGKKVGEEVVLPANGSGSVQTVTAAAAVSGERKAVVLLINFLDKTVPCGPSTIRGIVSPDPNRGYTNANVSDYYYEASYQQVYMNFDVQQDDFADIYGPFTIDAYSTDPCTDQTSIIYNWASMSDQAATAAGVPLSLYQHIVYVFPTGHSCGFVALGNIGCGTQCRTWMSGCGYADAFAHELGHNLGMHHAASDTNNDGTQEDEYGDFSCIMGYGGVGYRHPNAAHKDHMGWFNAFPGASTTVTAGGVYNLAPLGLDPVTTTLPQALKIYIPARGEYYYLSYRVKDGYEQSFWNTTYPDKLNIHRARPTAGNKSYFVRALALNQQFSDASLGVTITNIGNSPDPVTGYVSVKIDYACVANAPTVAVSPQTRSTSGTAVSYSASVTNNDAGGCGLGAFEAIPVVPTGWQAVVTTAPLSIAAGQSATASWTVTPAATAVDGTYSLSIIVRDPIGAHADVVRYVSCVVDKTAPAPLATLSAVVNRKNVVELSWGAANEQVMTYRIYRNVGAGFVLLASTNSTSYLDATVSAGSTARYYIKVVDIVGNESSPSNEALVTLGGTNARGKK